jgi:hypothetical protein
MHLYFLALRTHSAVFSVLVKLIWNEHLVDFMHNCSCGITNETKDFTVEKVCKIFPHLGSYD